MEDDEPTRAEELPADLEGTVQDAPDGLLGPGIEVHGYVIDGQLGKGGMGFVYSATHPLIGKRAAIKILKPEVSSSPIILERFIQEARAVNQIQHPNIVDIFAFGTLPDGRAYHVMDLLAGETLRKRLRRGALHPSEAAAIIDQTASALAAAHDKGFVHRDLKPDNIFLVEREDGWPEVKLLDFGLAKLMPEAGIAPFTTKVGVMLGTPEYMSPEQARGVGVDHRTDIYALGVLTFEVLARQRPFASTGDAFAMMQAHAEEPPPSLGAVVAGLPPELVQLVDAMLAKEPGARPSLAAVRTVLKRVRTTQLPSRTAAGLEIASVQGDAAASGSFGLRTSAVGAEPLLPSQPDPVRFSQMRTPPQPAPTVRVPGASSPRARAPSQPEPYVQPTSNPPRARTPSQPEPYAQPTSNPPRARPPSQPEPYVQPASNPPAILPSSTPPAVARHASQPPSSSPPSVARHASQPPFPSSPGMPARSTHGTGGGSRTTSPNLPALGAAGLLDSNPPAMPASAAPAHSAPGLAARPPIVGTQLGVAPPIAGTQLGVAAPIAPIGGTQLGVAPAPRPSGGRIVAPAPAPAPRRRTHLWILVAALVAIAAGIALALYAT